jgi:hypothetical protein
MVSAFAERIVAKANAAAIIKPSKNFIFIDLLVALFKYVHSDPDSNCKAVSKSGAKI